MHPSFRGFTLGECPRCEGSVLTAGENWLSPFWQCSSCHQQYGPGLPLRPQEGLPWDARIILVAPVALALGVAACTLWRGIN